MTKALHTPLFNYKEVAEAKSRGANLFSPTPAQLAAAADYARKINDPRFLRQKETAVRDLLVQDVMQHVLGYRLYDPGKPFTLARERPIRGGAVDVALGNFNTPDSVDEIVAPFELKGPDCADLDRVMSALLDDLYDRGLLKNTLVITLGEFGRTPQINPSLGRDHFASAWSTSLSGCGVKGGVVYGKTDDDGNKVIEGEIGAEALFATIFSALGINHQKNYYVGARPVPLTNPGTKPIPEVLA